MRLRRWYRRALAASSSPHAASRPGSRGRRRRGPPPSGSDGAPRPAGMAVRAQDRAREVVSRLSWPRSLGRRSDVDTGTVLRVAEHDRTEIDTGHTVIRRAHRLSRGFTAAKIRRDTIPLRLRRESVRLRQAVPSAAATSLRRDQSVRTVDIVCDARHSRGHADLATSTLDRLGGDYNPEQWPREVWAEDVRLMRRPASRGDPRGVLLGAARAAAGRVRASAGSTR